MFFRIPVARPAMEVPLIWLAEITPAVAEVGASVAPLPTTIAAELFVLPVIALKAVAADPAQEPKSGAAPLREVRQSVPAPPVAVVVSVVPFQNAAPLLEGEVTLAPPPPPAKGDGIGLCASTARGTSR